MGFSGRGVILGVLAGLVLLGGSDARSGAAGIARAGHLLH